MTLSTIQLNMFLKISFAMESRVVRASPTCRLICNTSSSIVCDFVVSSVSTYSNEFSPIYFPNISAYFFVSSEIVAQLPTPDLCTSTKLTFPRFKMATIVSITCPIYSSVNPIFCMQERVRFMSEASLPPPISYNPL